MIAAILISILVQAPARLDEATRKRAFDDWEACVNVKVGDDYERAIAACNGLLKGQPADTLIPANLGMVYAKRGVLQSRLRRWSAASDDLNVALPLVAEDRKNWVRSERGLVFQELKQYAAAYADLNAVVVSEPASSDDYLRALVGRGINYFLTGDYPRALGDFDSLVRRDKGNGHIFYLRSRARNQMEDFNGADEDMAEAVRRDKNIEATMKSYGVTWPTPKRRPAPAPTAPIAAPAPTAPVATPAAPAPASAPVEPVAETPAPGMTLTQELWTSCVVNQKANPGSAIIACDTLLRDPGRIVDSDKPFIYAARGFLKANQKFWYTAIDDLTLALRGPSLNREQRAHVMLTRGMARNQVKQFKEALEDFNALVALEPPGTDIYTQAQSGRSVALAGLKR